MNQTRSVIHRVVSLLSAMMLLVGLFAVGATVPQHVDAATVQVADKTYDIAVVYDNSGSMYQDGRMAWSQAKFAMEIFASMLDYENGDKLTIYPMNKTEIVMDPNGFDNRENEWVKEKGKNNSYKNDATATKGVSIESVEDIDKITNMYTPYCGSTPANQITNAKDNLSGSSADERWIIVLTDGVINGYEGNKSGLQDMLESHTTADQTNQFGNVTKKGIKMQYLYFEAGDNADAELKDNKDEGFYAKSAKDGRQLQDALIEISKEIFQRDELTKFGSYYNEAQKMMALDLSMKNLVVFAQGENVNVTALKGGNNQTLMPTLDSKQRTYSMVATGRIEPVRGKDGSIIGTFDTIVADTSLAGQVVSFPACAAGNYTLEYNGEPTKLQIFYEPDVKLDIKLFKDGVEVDASSGKLQAGTYTVKTDVVDSKTGRSVKDHPLMGGKVDITTTLSTADGEKGEPLKGPEVTVTLTPDTETQIVVEAEYLGKYKISSEDMPDLPWPKGGFGVTEDIGFEVKVEHTQPNGEFKINDMKNWKPIRVSFMLKGKTLTAEEMKNLKVNVEVSNGMAYSLEELSGESAYTVYLGKNSDGSFGTPTVGTGSITVNATFPNNLGEEIPAAGKTDFTIKSIDYAINAVVEQDDAWYALSDTAGWKPVRVDMTIDGRPLTDEELKTVTLTAVTDPAMNVRCEMLPGKSAFNVYVGQDQNGAFVAPETGDYALSLTATVTDEYGNSVNAAAETEYGVHRFSKLTQILMIVLPILAIIMLWLFYMTRKVLPKQVGKDERGCFVNTLTAGRLGTAFIKSPSYDRRSKSLGVGTTNSAGFDAKCTVTLKLRPIDNRFTPSKERSMEVVGINSNCKTVSIDGTKYIKEKGNAWVPTGTRLTPGVPPPPIKQVVKNPKIVATRVDGSGLVTGTMHCQLKNLK